MDRRCHRSRVVHGAAPRHTAEAQTQDIAQGQTLYRQHCGICHGILASTGTEYRFTPPLVRLAVLTPAATGEQVAVAPPHGPSLQGVYGRPAGTVQGFTYPGRSRRCWRVS